MDSKWAEIRKSLPRISTCRTEKEKKLRQQSGQCGSSLKLQLKSICSIFSGPYKADTARRLKEVLTMKLLDVEGVKALLPIQNTKAYAIIRQLNEELREKGYMTIRGRVPEKYLIERFGLGEDTP